MSSPHRRLSLAARRFLTLAIGPLLIASGASAQQVRFVDDTGRDAGDCTDVRNPCATIGFAIERSEEGDVVSIAAGTYIESVTVDRSLSLRGAGPQETLIRASTARDSRDRVITIGPGLEVDISGVTISRGWAGSWSVPPRLGGGIYVEDSVLNLSDVSIFRNKTTGGGGAGIANINASGTYSNVIFRDNFTDSSGGRGGGVFNVGSHPVLINVLFIDNEGELGGGMHNTGGSAPILTNVTFKNNIAPLEGGGIFNDDESSPTLFNSIVWGNMSGDDGQQIFNDEDGAIELRHSLYGDGRGDVVEGGRFVAIDSLTENPRFLAHRSPRLRADSPAIDAGDPDTDLSIFPVDEAGNPIDLDGNPRVVGAAIDIGAYEHQQPTRLFRSRFEGSAVHRLTGPTGVAGTDDRRSPHAR